MEDIKNMYFYQNGGKNPNNCQKQKIFYLTGKLLLHNMAASSGLRENVYPNNFFLKMFIFIILLEPSCQPITS